MTTEKKAQQIVDHITYDILLSNKLTLTKIFIIDYLIYFKTLLSCTYMEDLVKKLEEQISFLQNEISQMSDELYSQQKEVSVLKKQVLNLEKRINELESGDDASMVMVEKKPPHPNG